MDSDTESPWSDTSEEDEAKNKPPLQSRAYQIEMFEASMQQNIVAVMGTGSGKTLIAKLRIEAELERSPDQLIWFVAPTVVLAYQQFRFLSQQLRAVQFRLITGHDNAEYWTTLEIWEKVLHNIQVVVSTPAILNIALNHGLVSLHNMSLLIFDEAHHCVGNAPMACIMRHHYHPHRIPGSLRQLPHILGLSASPITKKKAEEVAELEKNLNAVCKSPNQQLDEYTDFVNMPKLLTLTPITASQPTSDLLTALTTVVSGINIDHDPQTIVLRKSSSSFGKEKLEKFVRKQCTPAMNDLQSLLRPCTDIQQNLGTWACDMFIKKCIEKAELTASRGLTFVATEGLSAQKHAFVASKLQALHGKFHVANSDSRTVSAKVTTLLEFLQRGYRSDLHCLVFVKARHTAWSLTEIINNHPLTQGQYRAFSFVGVSNPTRRNVFDFAELRDQHDNLESFRRGGLNVCVATSVLEEGVDVPAMNLVICFDERPNFRSFIQSRGRARQKESQFVMFPEAAIKMEQWRALEAEMKEECQKSLDDVQKRKDIEEIDEGECEVFRVDSTGALLTFAEARQLLDQFCAKLPSKDRSEPTNAVYLIKGEPGFQIRAAVRLPSTLPPRLQIAQSRSSWRTEKRANQDAAFQAYRALYEAGLVTDHLLPPEVSKENKAPKAGDKVETRDSFYAVAKQYEPWSKVLHLWDTPDRVTIYAHRLHVEEADFSHPSVLILLPLRLPEFKFDLFKSESTRIHVTIDTGVEMHDYSMATVQEITVLLLTTILGRRLQGLQKEQLPFFLVPNVDPASLQGWYEVAATSTSFTSYDLNQSMTGQTYLVRRLTSNVPYLWQPTAEGGHHEAHETRSNTCPESINGVRIPRRLNYFQPDADGALAWKQTDAIPTAECSVLGLPGEFGRVMTLIPSITYMLEVSLRSAAACEGPLVLLGLNSHGLVSQALTLPGASSRNYERLEFLGDLLLKFYATIQLFVDHPDYSSYQLTRNRTHVLNNARLQRSTRNLGLDQYLTREAFSGKGWAAGAGHLRSSMRKGSAAELSSKILADVVEATIGATSLSGVDGNHSEANVLTTLKLFIDEVPWRPLCENMALIRSPDQPFGLTFDMLAPVESMIGYAFHNRAILAEALTQSSLAGGGRSTYDRLEFLGDAILDFIVGRQLFHSRLQLGPAEMSTRRAALVSHQALAFFVQNTSSVRSTFHTQTDSRTKESINQEQHKNVYLPDYIRRVSASKMPEEQRATLSTFCKVRHSIIQELAVSKKFPWIQLSRLAAPKSHSDIFESILAAVFVDSKGDISACEVFLEKIGYMGLVRRLVDERDIDVFHPESILTEALQAALISQGHSVSQSSLQYVTQERENGITFSKDWRCKVMYDGQELAHVKHASCSDEARYRAAEKAVRALRKKENVIRDSKESERIKKSEGGQGIDTDDPYEEEDEVGVTTWRRSRARKKSKDRADATFAPAAAAKATTPEDFNLASRG